MATNFSFRGTRQDKRAFVELNVRKVLICKVFVAFSVMITVANIVLLGAVQQSCEGVMEAQIDYMTKEWLKHAPKRCQQEMKKDTRKPILTAE